MLAYAVIPIIIVVLLIIIIFEANLNISIREQVKKQLSDQAEQINAQMQERLTEYRQDIHFLHSTPPVSGLVRAAQNNGLDAKDSTTYQQWAHRLETIFIAFIKNNQEYDQARIISAGNQGDELIRVDRISGQISAVDLVNLQSKKDRDYFTQSTKLADGELYMSQFSLNREFGKIQFPYRPTLRISLPVFSETAERFGFLILNINAQLVLQSLTTMIDKQFQLVLTDNQGYYLVTPNEKEKFSRDLAPELKWQTTYQTKEIISEDFTKMVRSDNQNISFYAYQKTVRVAGNTEEGFVRIRILAPSQVISDLAMERRKIVYAFLLAITIILLVVLVILSRSMRRNNQLAEARALSAAIIQGSKNAIISVTSDCIITSWNKGAEAIFKYQEHYALDKSLMTLSLFEDINIQEYIQNLSENNTRQEVSSVKFDGNKHNTYLSLSLSAIVGDNQGFTGVAIIVRDQTIERQAEEKVKLANSELEKKVAQRTAELQKASTVKNAFISNISHEMRTPLNGIMGTLSLIQKDPLTEDQKRYLEMTGVSVNSLAVLINDILDLSKIEAGKLDLDFKAFNPIKLIESLSCSLAVKAQEKGLEFIVDITDLRCHSIVSDPHRFSQVLTNLINNAIKFTDTGYIKVKAYSELTDDNNLRLCCSVCDTGVGIAESNKNKLFQAFSQEDTEVAAKYGGTGLGLSICRQLTNLLNGDITFDSIKDQGSSFNFYIEIPSIDSKLSSPEKLLEDKFCEVITPSTELSPCLYRMLESFAANCIKTRGIEAWLLDKKSTPSEQIDLLLIDLHSPYLTILDTNWHKMVEVNKKAPLVAVLLNSGEPIPLMQHFKVVPLNKPILVSEFVKKCVVHKEQTSATLPLVNSKVESALIYTAGDKNKITGANILIVDDNEINIEVASGILSELPVNIFRARNGKQALEVLFNKSNEGIEFHCILMDCQMPILDGYQTSEKIRAGLAGTRYKKIPIIAMTANAMLGERKKCMNAGMSDYITKPIHMETLITIVIKWTLSIYQAAAVSQNSEDKIVEVEQINKDSAYDPKVWDIKSALVRLMNNVDLFKQICLIFHEKSSAQMESLSKYVTNMDFDKIGKKSHALKGSAGDIGATELHKLLTEVEKQAKQENAVEISSLMEKTQKSYENFIAKVDEYLR